MRHNHTLEQRSTRRRPVELLPDRRTEPAELDDLASELELWLEREFGSTAPRRVGAEGAIRRLAGLVLTLALWVGVGVAIAWLLS